MPFCNSGCLEIGQQPAFGPSVQLTPPGHRIALALINVSFWKRVNGLGTQDFAVSSRLNSRIFPRATPMKTDPLQLEISGPTALWTRPDTGSSSVSYVAPIFSAVKGIVVRETREIPTLK